MGLYDSVYVHDAHALGLFCPAGHDLGGIEFQTKAMDDPSMGSFHIVARRLYLEIEPQSRRRQETEIVEAEPFHYIARRDSPLVPEDLTGDVNIYAHCKQCLPVLYEQEFGYGADRLGEAYPWVEWSLQIVKGFVHSTAPLRVESRDDVRKKYPTAIPDDDRVAKRHFELLRKQKGQKGEVG